MRLQARFGLGTRSRSARKATSYDEAREQLSEWLRNGVIQSPEHRLEGIENVGKAFADLFAGENFGKTIVAL